MGRPGQMEKAKCKIELCPGIKDFKWIFSIAV
jgi:hypothetical protein